MMANGIPERETSLLGHGSPVIIKRRRVIESLSLMLREANNLKQFLPFGEKELPGTVAAAAMTVQPFNVFAEIDVR